MKAIEFIDDGYFQALTRKAGYRDDPDHIEPVALECVSNDETLLQILYYDRAPSW